MTNRAHSPWRIRPGSAAIVALSSVIACASTPEPEALTNGVLALAQSAGPEASAEAVAEGINSAGADFVVLRAGADSAWYADVAESTSMELSGPGIDEGMGFGYLSLVAPVGDTTIAIPVGEDDAIVMHDALYDLGSGLFLDIIAFRADFTTDPQALVHAFLEYMATDVMTTAPLLLAVQAPEQALADTLEVLLRPSFVPPTRCAEGGAEDGVDNVGGLRLFVGTPAQIRCSEVSRPAGDRDALLTRLFFRR
jgi:hypothetical protein